MKDKYYDKAYFCLSCENEIDYYGSITNSVCTHCDAVLSLGYPSTKGWETRIFIWRELLSLNGGNPGNQKSEKGSIPTQRR